MKQKIKGQLFNILLIFLFLIKYSLTQTGFKEPNNGILFNNTFIPIKYLPEEEKKKLKENLDDLVYISAGKTIKNFTTFYDQLTPIEQKMYDIILEASTKSTPEFEIYILYDDTVSKSSMEIFQSKIDTESVNHEMMFYTIMDDTEYESFTTENIMSLNRKIEMEKIDIMKKIEELNLTTDYAILRFIHDYIVVKNTYLLDESRTHIRDLYGSLVENLCVCEGYAEEFQYLAQQYNIDCIIARSEIHEWNYVKMNDKWYILDSTWDDPGYELGGYGYDQEIYTDYFLAGSTYVESNESEDEHTLIYDYYIGYISYDYPEISKYDYIPSDTEINE
ncbi:hypothetical protein PIROE2DRAFT_4648, partial [Piromyces sp. E2]